ncbi:periplasmic nitrate reductase, NapE protein [Oceanisphaera pacifica]|uniref:Periplasmic nitrate reductase, NapE protein n=1 Tax=Oceanisphaera pacifica TaxID=2818389 RepID=A0ABS3NDD3_9GAMM|nr:periplasmic nitrate reductase, NapE protein [Oceanisphaera pacifica]MBO1518604.1 periplasmic nitrate reductase, NapE protein [Oceanisphaera pacifica]
MSNSTPSSSRRREWQTFLLLTVVLIPLLSVMTVAGYGFIVWFLQMIFGPPGHVS